MHLMKYGILILYHRTGRYKFAAELDETRKKIVCVYFLCLNSNILSVRQTKNTVRFFTSKRSLFGLSRTFQI